VGAAAGAGKRRDVELVERERGGSKEEGVVGAAFSPVYMMEEARLSERALLSRCPDASISLFSDYCCNTCFHPVSRIRESYDKRVA
jgi:hypothetical protein